MELFDKMQWKVHYCYSHVIGVVCIHLKYALSVDIPMSHNAQNAKKYAGAISKILHGLCVCTGDNPLAKARGSSSHKHAQTIQ